MKTEEFNKYLEEYKEQIDAKLREIVSGTNYSEQFRKVLEYALFPGGKRLRPVLCLEWHNVFAPADEYALSFACGIEILHSYSLIHDDMPCMDNDDIRRGKPSVHKKFGEGVALLAGDALLDLAYKVLYAPTPDSEVGPFYLYSAMCGDEGLIKGQYADLYGNIETRDGLTEMYKLKTGALITLSCICGYALGNNLNYKTCKKITECLRDNITDSEIVPDDRRLLDYVMVTGFGDSFGTAFQLYDDITEYIDGETIGKTNIMNHTDLDTAKRMLNSKLNDAANTLDIVNGDTAFLRELLNKFVIV